MASMVLRPCLKHEARSHRGRAWLLGRQQVDRIHVESIARERRKSQLNRICLTACLPEINLKRCIRGGCVPDLSGLGPLPAAGPLPNERPPRPASKAGAALFQPPPPPALRDPRPAN